MSVSYPRSNFNEKEVFEIFYHNAQELKFF